MRLSERMGKPTCLRVAGVAPRGRGQGGGHGGHICCCCWGCRRGMHAHPAHVFAETMDCPQWASYCEERVLTECDVHPIGGRAIAQG